MKKVERLQELFEDFMIVDRSKSEAINKLVNKSLQMVSQHHLWHLQTQSYSQHEAIGDFYESLSSLLDNLAEHSIGIGGNIISLEQEPLMNYSHEILIKNLEDFGQTISNVNDIAGDKGSLVAVLDDMESLVSKTLYRLTLS